MDTSNTFTKTTPTLAGSGAYVLQKLGAGDLTLATGNTYTGATQILGGKIILAANNTLPVANALTVNGGTFEMGTFSQTTGVTTLTAGSITATPGHHRRHLDRLQLHRVGRYVSANLAGGNMVKGTAGTVDLTQLNGNTFGTAATNTR